MKLFIEEEILDTAIKDRRWKGVTHLITTLYGVHVNKKSDEALIIVNNAIGRLPLEALIVLSEMNEEFLPALHDLYERKIEDMLATAESALAGDYHS